MDAALPARDTLLTGGAVMHRIIVIVFERVIVNWHVRGHLKDGCCYFSFGNFGMLFYRLGS